MRLACVLKADPARVDLLEKAAQDRCDAVDVTVALDNLRVEGFSSLSSFDKLIDDLTSDASDDRHRGIRVLPHQAVRPHRAPRAHP